MHLYNLPASPKDESKESTIEQNVSPRRSDDSRREAFWRYNTKDLEGIAFLDIFMRDSRY